MHWGLSSKYYGIVAAYIILAPYVQADISGKVFRDFNANGVFDTGGSFNEVGQAGVTVKAFDAAGVEKASVTSAADGSYTLTGLASGADYRVEFSWTETWLNSSASGGTSVQFAKDGATNVHFALNAPEDFSQTNPQLVTANFLVGEPTSIQVADKPRLVEFAYLSGADGTSFNISTDATAVFQPEVTDVAVSSAPSSVGTLNAMPPNMAGRSRTDTVKMREVGPLYGLAYHRDTNVLLAGAFMKRFAGFPGGASDSKLGTIYAIDRKVNPNTVTPFFTTNAGVDSHDYVNASMNAPFGDTTAASQAGKAGWGDIDLSPDGSMLYAVNLFDKKIYAIPVTKGGGGLSAGTASTITFPASATTTACANGDWVPGGLKVTQGSVFATVTCTAETSQAPTDLHFYVYKFAQDTPDLFTKVVDHGNYPRDIDWHPWVNDPYNQSHSYNQPWLMDVEFDDLGRIYIGVRNRSSDMVPAYDNNYFFEFGDTMVGTPNTDGTFDTTYTDEFVNDNTDGHVENDMGALAHWSGSGTIVTPAHIGNLLQGIRTYAASAALSSTANGTVSPLRYFGIHQTPRSIATVGDPFGKVAGLGDVEVLAQPAPIEIGNRVWLDTDADGIQDAGETGIDGVAVALTCGANTATTTSANGGQYLFSSTGNASFMKAGESCTISIAANQASLNGLSVTAQNQDGLTNNHAVTDVRDSDANPDGSISFTLGAAGENNHGLDIGYTSKPTITYSAVSGPEPMTCTSDVRLATSVNVNGDSQAAGSTGAGFNSLVTFDYATTGVLTTPYSAATAGQLGAVWGLAYDSVRKKLYTSAFLKRHTSFGPNGSGAIYQMDTQSATATPSLLIDLAANGVDVGADPRAVSDGTVDSPDELPIDGTKPSWDQTAFAQVAKISIGDIDMSADGNTLWAINLKQRELVAVNLTNKTVGAKLAIPNPGCSQGDYRPWALKLHLGKAWIGTVCSAEQSQVAADLKAYVQVFDGSSFSNAFELPLDYTKGNVGNGPGAEKWQPWLTSYQTLATDPKFAIYPQPILSDIEFDMDGSMILGFMDRMGHQVGVNNYTPNHPDTSLVQGQTGGDILRVCNNNGVYSLESNATCSSGSTMGKDKGQGPGNGEYYWGEMWDYNQWNADGGFHQETSFGGLAFKAGSGEIALTSMNPLNPNANAGGVIWLDNATGGRSSTHADNVQVYRQASSSGPHFGKAAGMGDVEIFCADLPVQPDLKLVKTVDKSTAKRGETVLYTLTLTNESATAANNVSVQEVLPAQTLYISQSGDGSYDPITGVWTLGKVSGISTKQLTITVTIK